MVAAGFAFSQAAGTTATIVKLTRTTLIIPLVLGFGLAVPFLFKQDASASQSLARRVYAAVPAFIILFVLAAAAEHRRADRVRMRCRCRWRGAW